MNFRSLIQPVLVAVALIGLVAFAASPMLAAPTHDDAHILVPDASTAPVPAAPAPLSPLTRGLIWLLAAAAMAGAVNFPTVAGTNFPTMQAASQILQQNNWDINSLMGDWVDRGPWVYYDTIYAVTAVALSGTYTPFSLKMGQVDPVTGAAKTKLQTNMIENGSFGATRCLILMQLGITFPSYMTKANVDKLLNCMYLEVRIAEKIFFEGLPEIYPSGTGLMGVSNNTGEATWTLGLPIPMATRRYERYAKYIAPLIPITWTLTLNGASGTSPTLTLADPGTGVSIVNGNNTCIPIMKVFMDGLTDRAVQ